MREFVLASLAVGAGIGARCLDGWLGRPSRAARPRADGGRRRLGSTGIEVTPLTIGVNELLEPAVIRHALDRGITTIETSRVYGGGRAEETVGEAIRGYPREDLVICTKVPRDSSYSQVMRAAHASLRALRTDYIDILLIHGLNDDIPSRREPTEAALVDLKRAGKIRACGAATHNLNQILPLAMRERVHDVVLAFFNAMSPPADVDLLSRARASGIGIIAMKTHSGYPRMVSRTEMSAVLRFVVSHRFVDSATVRMESFDQVDDYREALERPYSDEDGRVISRLVAALDADHCRSCYRCVGSCAAGIVVPEVTRSLFYLDGYGDERTARQYYASLVRSGDARPCEDCSPCRVGCSRGLEINRRMKRAERRLGRA